MPDPPTQPGNPWDELAEVGRYPGQHEAQEHALVILAMRQPCWVHHDVESGGYLLHAEPAAAPAIARELREYDAEQPQKPVPVGSTGTREVFRYPAGWDLYFVWALSLCLMFLLQRSDPSITDRLASSSRDLIGGGEWWRPFTALFLHADTPHLLGNLLSGLFFGVLVSRLVGPLRGWLLILASGVAGNTITSALSWPEPFSSIGASTAVFGALGILTGLGFVTMLRAPIRLPWARITAPLIGGVILLGWLGGGSPDGNTDVLGHVFGFSAGLVAGLFTAILSPATAGAPNSETATAEPGEPI